MHRVKTIFKGLLGTAVAIALGYAFYVGGTDRVGTPALTPPPAAAQPAPAPLEAKARPDSFAALVKEVKPAVVNISTTQVVRGPRGRGLPFGSNGDGLFERYFGEGRPREQRLQSLGSGFIIDREGYILTNNHVIERATMIMVKLGGNGREYEAKVIGRDPRTDLALIKIDARADLPVVRLGDSEALEVGDWIIAIGNPFGLAQTVTAGIVSAKERVIGAGPYDDFIQTDASINPGNSGGPLFNTRGEVVGINTAIFSESGGSIGIGFATPINLAKDLMLQLKARGRVSRGWLGVSIQPVTPELQRQLRLRTAAGALVAEVMEGSPADRAGIQPGDLIIAFDGREVRESAELPRLVSATPLGKEVVVRLVRGGREISVKVTIRELQERAAASTEGPIPVAVKPIE